MLVSLVIVSVIIPVALLLVTNIFQQSQNVHDTILGVQQDQTAGQALVQYLHATIVVLPGSNATTLNASLLAGVNSSGTQTATLNAVFTNSANPKMDATLVMSFTPNGGRNVEHRHLRRGELPDRVHLLPTTTTARLRSASRRRRRRPTPS